MLWYKAWLETRWRFLIGLLLGAGSATLLVLMHPMFQNMQLEAPDLGGELNEMVKEALKMASTFTGYVWSQWFGKNLLQVWSFFAILIGVGGIATEKASGSALWTLSLPVTRRRLFGVRAATGALELLALALLPSLLIPLLARFIGQSYPVGETLVYSLMLFAGGLFFYSMAILLSTLFGEQLKAVILGLAIVFAMALLPLLSKGLEPYSVSTLMSGRQYFLTGELPLAGLAAYLLLAAALYLIALRVLERRDF
jgi:ABC-2 type transport system permease protein